MSETMATVYLLTGFFGYVAVFGWAIYVGVKEMYAFLRYRFYPPTFFKDGGYVEFIWIAIWIVASVLGMYFLIINMPFDIGFSFELK
jgi:hypothetical protein